MKPQRKLRSWTVWIFRSVGTRGSYWIRWMSFVSLVSCVTSCYGRTMTAVSLRTAWCCPRPAGTSTACSATTWSSARGRKCHCLVSVPTLFEQLLTLLTRLRCVTMYTVVVIVIIRRNCSSTVSPITTHVSVVCPSLMCHVWHVCIFLKPFHGYRCHLAGTPVGSGQGRL